MITLSDLSDIPPLSPPVGLTIGTFDGIHLGHQALLKTLREKVSGTLSVFTFSNHPSGVINSRPSTPLLITLEHKLKLLKECGVNLSVLSPFNTEFASQGFDQFLSKLHNALHFSHLVLGEGASFGKNRQGNESEVRAFAKDHHFEVDYFPKIIYKNEPISSGRIRNHLQKGEFAEVKALLGRPYSIYAPLVKKKDRFQLDASELCLPPDGIYPIRLINLETAVRDGRLTQSPTAISRINEDNSHLGHIHIPSLQIDLPPSFRPGRPLVEAIFHIYPTRS